MGPAWDRERVRDSAGWIGLADEARRHRSSLAETEACWRAANLQAEQADAAPELAGLDAELGVPGGDEALDDIEDKARALGELRRNIAEHRRLTAERFARGVGRPAGLPGGTRTALWIALVALLIVMLGVFAAAVSDVAAVRLLCAGLAVAGAALLCVLYFSRRAPDLPARTGDEEVETALSHVAARVGELAGSLGFADVPSDSDLETAAELIETAAKP